MGSRTEDIVSSFLFADPEDEKLYEVAKTKFDNHFVAKKNVIYERARFDQRVQGPDETLRIL